MTGLDRHIVFKLRGGLAKDGHFPERRQRLVLLLYAEMGGKWGEKPAIHITTCKRVGRPPLMANTW